MVETTVGLHVLQWFVGIMGAVITGLGTIIVYLFRTGRADLIEGYKREEKLVESNHSTAQALDKIAERSGINQSIIEQIHKITLENSVKLQALAEQIHNQDETIQQMAEKDSATTTRKK